MERAAPYYSHVFLRNCRKSGVSAKRPTSAAGPHHLPPKSDRPFGSSADSLAAADPRLADKLSVSANLNHLHHVGWGDSGYARTNILIGGGFRIAGGDDSKISRFDVPGSTHL